MGMMAWMMGLMMSWMMFFGGSFFAWGPRATA